jgi:RNA recognition motif-containing protein
VNIYVSNLDFNTSKEQLGAAFSAYGSVKATSVLGDRFTDQYRSVGFVEMTDYHEGQNAVNCMNGRRLAGRRVTAIESKSRKLRGRNRNVEARWWRRRV